MLAKYRTDAQRSDARFAPMSVKWTWLARSAHILTVTASCVVLITACGGSDRDPDRPLPPDPAMTPVTPQPANPAVAADTHPAPEIPTGPRRRDDQLFIPDLGWVDEGEFWQRYLHAPETLPASLDLSALHHLRIEYEQTQAEPNADAPASSQDHPAEDAPSASTTRAGGTRSRQVSSASIPSGSAPADEAGSAPADEEGVS